MFHRQFGRAPRSDDIRNILGPPAAVSFLVPAYEVWLKLRAPPNVKDTDAFRSVKFVRGERKEIHPQTVRVDSQFSGRLNGVGVTQHSLAATDGGDFFDGKEKV